MVTGFLRAGAQAEQGVILPYGRPLGLPIAVYPRPGSLGREKTGLRPRCGDQAWDTDQSDGSSDIIGERG